MKTTRYQSGPLTPATGSFTRDQLAYIDSIATSYGWTRAEAMRVIVSAGKEALERKAREARAVSGGYTQIDPAAFGYSPDCIPVSGCVEAEA